MKNITQVYTSGVFDLLHASHIRAMKAAKAAGGHNCKLIVGISTDEDTATYKRKPIIPYEERLRMVEELCFVDKVITAPLFTNEQFYKFHDIDLHIQGDDDAGEIDYYKGGKELDIIRFIGRDPVESTTNCINQLEKCGLNNFTVETLHGGISNKSWKLVSEDQSIKYVLKYLQSTTSEYFSKRHDCLIIGGTFALYEYIEGVVGHVTSREMVNYFKDYSHDHRKHVVDAYHLDFGKNKAFPRLAKLAEATSEGREFLDEYCFYDVIFSEGRKWCWSHNDMVRENIIRTSDINNPIKFIDWEYAEMAPVEMDIASCLLNDVIDEPDLANYFDTDIVYLMAAFQAIAWYNWYQERIDTDKFDQAICSQYFEKYLHFRSRINKENIVNSNYFSSIINQ